MADEGPSTKRVRLSLDSLEKMSKAELIAKCLELGTASQSPGEASTTADSNELTALRESEEKLRQQHAEATRRENILIKTLTSKEQELAECASQIEELKQYQLPSNAQLRSVLLDPTINLMFQRMRKELDASKQKLEESQNELSAWKFTPDSQTGKRLMARCRMLIQENEELGKQISSGRIAKLEGDIALERALISEMKSSQAETDEFLLELDGEMEGMQSTVYLLQQQLKEAKEQLTVLRADNVQLLGRCTRAEAALRASVDRDVAADASVARFVSPDDNARAMDACSPVDSLDRGVNEADNAGVHSEHVPASGYSSADDEPTQGDDNMDGAREDEDVRSSGTVAAMEAEDSLPVPPLSAEVAARVDPEGACVDVEMTAQVDTDTAARVDAELAVRVDTDTKATRVDADAAARVEADAAARVDADTTAARVDADAEARVGADAVLVDAAPSGIVRRGYTGRDVGAADNGSSHEPPSRDVTCELPASSDPPSSTSSRRPRRTGKRGSERNSRRESGHSRIEEDAVAGGEALANGHVSAEVAASVDQ